MKENDFTGGPIVPLMIKFMLPVLFAMFLQGLVGALAFRIPVALLI